MQARELEGQGQLQARLGFGKAMEGWGGHVAVTQHFQDALREYQNCLQIYQFVWKWAPQVWQVH